METLAWVIIVALFVLGMLGAVFPVLPGALAIYAAFFVYGLFISFEPFGFWFWSLETALVAAIFAADYAANALGVRKFGGTRASVIGSTIGVIAGIFIPFGIIIGPFAGAVIGEMLMGADLRKALNSGMGAIVGFFSGMIAKLIFQTVMIGLFIVWVF